MADHQRLFRRVSLDLGSTDAARLPTDERHRRLAQERRPATGGALFPVRPLPADRQQPARVASRPTSRASGTTSLAPPWDSKYTVNINTEMNYWPAEVCNLAECHEPLFDVLDDLAESGAEAAKAHYDAPRLGAPSQHRPLARHGADQRLEPRHLADRRRLALPAPVVALPVPATGLPPRTGLSGS